MTEVSLGIQPLLAKLSKVKKKLDSFSAENDQLKQRVRLLEQKLTEESGNNQNVKAEYERLKLAKSLVSSSNDKAEMKFRVNELVKEIDKCIALLNR